MHTDAVVDASSQLVLKRIESKDQDLHSSWLLGQAVLHSGECGCGVGNSLRLWDHGP